SALSSTAIYTLSHTTLFRSAISAGVPVLARTDGQVSLTAAIAEYLEETKLTKKPKTLSAYTTALAYFQESCHKQFILDIERKDQIGEHTSELQSPCNLVCRL